MPLPERKQTDGRSEGDRPLRRRRAPRHGRSKPEKERNRGPVPGGGARRAEGPWGSRSCPRHYRGASFSDVVRRALPQETGRLSRSDRPDLREIQWRSGTNYAAGRRLGARGGEDRAPMRRRYRHRHDARGKERAGGETEAQAGGLAARGHRAHTERDSDPGRLRGASSREDPGWAGRGPGVKRGGSG